MSAAQLTGAGRLPTETDEFVGRAAELRQIDELLREAHVVTLVGAGGVGKTRIALRAALAAAPRFTEGACLVELSALRDPALLPHTVAARLDLAELAAEAPMDALVTQLGDRHLLLILDTCEHLINPCAQLAEALLTGAPGITILATSREPLAIVGETIYSVRPLPVPTAARSGGWELPAGGAAGASSQPAGPGTASPGTASDGPGAGRHRRVAPPEDDGGAVELFARRAAAVVPGFVVDETNHAEVIQICRGLDGIPLNIELAAGRLRTMTLAEIGQRLDQRLSLLTGGSADDERHATVRNTVSWSYDTCTPAERALWARLSVFPNTFDVASAAEVCASGELSDVEIFQTIIRLVDKSLIVPASGGPGTGDGTDNGGKPRYRMLDMIREFGAERLAASGYLGGIRDRFIARYLALAQHVDAHVFDDNQLELFWMLRREHDNIRAALKYALDDEVGRRSRERDGGELANRLWAYWLALGFMVEGQYWLGKALNRTPQPSESRAWLLVARCFIGATRGAISEAIADGREATELGARLKLPNVIGRAQLALCLALTFGGELDEATEAGKTAERLLTQAKDDVGLVVLDAHLATLYNAKGKPDKSIGYYQRGLARFGERSSERLYHGYLHVAGGMAYRLVPGKEAEAARAFSLALTAKYDLDEVTGNAYALEMLGWLAVTAKRWQRAAWLLGAAQSLWYKCEARLSNSPAWEKQHQQAEAAARRALGPDAYTELFEAGRRRPLDQVVALAINNADSLNDRVPGVARPGLLTLTNREQEVAYLAAAGLSTGQIAGELFIAEPEAAQHLASIFAKLGISSPAQLEPWLGGLARPAPATAPELPQGRTGRR